MISRAKRVIGRIIENPKILVGRAKGLHWNHCLYCLDAERLINGKFKTIIDVGAHEGEFINAARWIFPNAKIYAFEPLEEYYNKIKKIKNVFAFNLGLWDKKENGKIYFNKANTGASSFLKPKEDYDKFIDGKGNVSGRNSVLKRFDSLSLKIERPCLVKIDVEGAEYNVLKGFGNKLKEADILQIEWFFRDFHEGQAKFSKLMRLLEKNGFAGFIQKEVNEHGGMPSVCDIIFFKNIVSLE